MDTEFEIKILDINTTQTIRTLKNLGFTKKSTIDFKRYVYPLTVKNGQKSWLRLRTEGAKTTLTVKEYGDDSIDGVKELEVNVGNFEMMNHLLEKIGHKSENYQENRRTVFMCDAYNAEISIDEWPHIPPYLEIEAVSSNIVESLLAKINIHKLPTTSAPTSEVYKLYGINLEKYTVLTFQNDSKTSE